MKCVISIVLGCSSDTFLPKPLFWSLQRAIKIKKKQRLKNTEMAGASTVGGGRGGAMMGRDKETRKRRDKKKELNKVLFYKLDSSTEFEFKRSSQENMDSVLRKRFEYFDITKNGKISKWELKEMMNSKGEVVVN